MNQISSLSFLFVAMAMGTGACDSGGERPEVDEPADSGAPLGGATASSDTIALPFAVDDHFHDTGFMGAAAQKDVPDVVIPRPNDCDERDPSAQGACHCYEYTGGIEGFDWAGLYWLSDYDNWGEEPGAIIEGGATRLSFRASSRPAGLPVSFLAGVVNDLEFSDELSEDQSFPLSTEMQTFEFDLRGKDYSQGVVGAFGWIIDTAEPGHLCIDDIRWE